MTIEYILGARAELFWLVVAVFIATAFAIAIVISRISSASAKRRLDDWARQENLIIVNAEERHGLKCGPFNWAAGGRGAKIFRIITRDATGSTRSGWIRFMIEPEIIWDGEEGTSSAPCLEKISPLPLVFMWGVMGAMIMCCVLWLLLSVGGEPATVVLRLSRRLLAQIGFSWTPLAEMAVLHLQFGGLGFIVASAFRFFGFRKQFGAHRDNATTRDI